MFESTLLIYPEYNFVRSTHAHVNRYNEETKMITMTQTQSMDGSKYISTISTVGMTRETNTMTVIGPNSNMSSILRRVYVPRTWEGTWRDESGDFYGGTDQLLSGSPVSSWNNGYNGSSYHIASSTYVNIELSCLTSCENTVSFFTSHHMYPPTHTAVYTHIPPTSDTLMWIKT